MATLGNVPAEAYTNTVKDSFSGNGSTTAFTMSLPTVTNDVRVVVENVIQDPTVAYSVSGTTLTFTSAPPTGTNNIYVVHLGPAVMTTVPPAEIADATTFASSLTVQGAFTSKGIDDNADAVALTIDSSENVLIGKTSDNFGTIGTAINQVGEVQITRASATPMYIRRNTNDGELIGFYKDGTAVGSIGVGNTDNLFIQGNSSHAGIQFGTNSAMPHTNGNTSDNAEDLGTSNTRWKDAYLSGGVYLGGTAAANKLEDYEEGTWTPILGGSTGTSGQSYSTQHGSYTKIGRVVHLQAYVVMASIGTSTGAYGQVQNLPFTAAHVQGYGGGIFQYFNLIGGTSVSQLIAYPEGNTTFAYVLYTAGSGTTTSYLGSSGWGTPTIMLSMTYLTNA